MKLRLPALALLLASFAFYAWAQPAHVRIHHEKQASLALWYDHPGVDTGKSPAAVDEGLPVGNGRIGGMVMGGVSRDRFAFNEDSLWTGSETVKGAYQALGDLILEFDGQEKSGQYRRELSLQRAVAQVSYVSGEIAYSRSYFVSHPAQAIVIDLRASKPDAYTGRFRLADAHGTLSVAEGNRLHFAGSLSNGLKYEAELRADAKGCEVHAEKDAAGGGFLSFKGCQRMTLLLAAATNYKMDYASGWRGEDPHAKVTAQLDAAEGKGIQQLTAEHEADFKSLFDRVSVNFGDSAAEQQAHPSDWRIAHAAEAGGDRELEAVLFQYGRYNLISSSRDALPANLQGLWNDTNDPAWNGDYHANINVQMNYWPSETANLPEMALPFFHLMSSQLPVWRKATAAEKEFNLADGSPARGWAIRTSHNIYGNTDWHWDKTANAWYAQHYWEHYAFGGDKEFLRTVAYPFIKEVTEFWQDHLKTLPDGTVVVPNGWSPEHGPWQDGVSYNQEIVWDLFDNYVHAAGALGVDKAYREQIAALRDHLAKPGIGSWGQMLEWHTELHDAEFPELDTTNDHHRHTSHLFGFYPGHQFSRTTTPELAKAAAVSLGARGDTGDSRREWVWAWRTALWARLGEGDKAHDQIVNLFKYNTLPNMIGNHPPQQWDGNFGITAAMTEMLMQSQAGEIELLPALPKFWPEGSVKGLRARGGFTVDVAWKNGKLVNATIHSSWGTKAILRYGTKTLTLSLKKGLSITIPAAGFGSVGSISAVRD
jgi:alpha-L-fucosidase 2